MTDNETILQEDKTAQLQDLIIKHRIINEEQWHAKIPRDIRLEMILLPDFRHIFNETIKIVNIDNPPPKKLFIAYPPDYTPTGNNSIFDFLHDTQTWIAATVKEFGLALQDIMNYNKPTKNTIYIWGRSNTGKTAITQSFCTMYDLKTGRPNSNPKSKTPFEDCIGKDIIHWEWPHIRKATRNTIIQMLDGSDTIITTKKYTAGISMRQTPIIITSNKGPTDLSHEAGTYGIIESKCYEFKMDRFLTDTIASKHFKTKETPFLLCDWMDFFYTCNNIQE